MSRLALWLLALSLPVALAGDPAGPWAADVVLLTGTGTAAGRDGSIRMLSKGQHVYSGDIVSSGPNSYLGLKFSDGGALVLRPASRFVVTEFHDPNAVVGAAPTAPAAPPVVKNAPVGVAPGAYPKRKLIPQKVVDQCRKRGFNSSKQCRHVRWRLREAAKRRAAERAAKQTLTARVPAYQAPPSIANAGTPPPVEGTAAAPALPSSAAAVAAAVSGESAGTGRAFFRLVKGGLRAVSGAIGKVNHDEYQITTPVATIGVRGTDYVSVICDSLCAYDPVVAEVTPTGMSAENGVITGVTDGSILVTSAKGSFPLDTGHYLLTLADGTQIPLPSIPRFLAVDPIPNPAECK